MLHTYSISGMSCMGCVNRVDSTLRSHPAISDVKVNLEKGSVVIDMTEHLHVDQLQDHLDQAGLHYTIGHENDPKLEEKQAKNKPQPTGSGIYHCPMHCEGDKNYDQHSDCPVCGMDLVEQPKLTFGESQFTCPMHPEVIKDEPGDCPICGMDLVAMQPEDDSDNAAFKDLLKKFKIAIVFTLPIFILAMSDMIPGKPISKVLSQTTQSWIQLFLSLPVVFYAGWMFFERGWKSIKTWNLNMFTLIAIGTSVAWIFSIVALLFPDIFPEQFKTTDDSVHVYFEAATVFLTLVLLGQLLEARAHGQTNSAIKKLLQLAPSEAILVDENGQDKRVAIQQIKIGNTIRVKPGDKIPVDGSVLQGSSNVDESMITGEPVAVTKKMGDIVRAGTINTNQSFLMKAEKIGADTVLSQIIEMVNTASRSRAPIQKLADKISKYFVPTVVITSIVTFIIWYIFGPSPALAFAFVNAIAVLIIACPCALGLATPMSVMVGVGKGAQHGVLIKNAEALEKLNKIDVLITDKTGTLTEGRPSVNKVVSTGSYNSSQLAQYLSAVNQSSEHPLAAATVAYAEKSLLFQLSSSNFEAISGMGAKATVENHAVSIGNIKMMNRDSITIPEEIIKQVEITQKEGQTVSYIAVDGQLEGFVAISDAIKKTSKKAIEALQDKGIEVIMLTGDNANTASAVAKELGLNDYQADCLPEDKLRFIEALQREGKKVAMAGDGINDAPALAQSDVGIAMGTGTDVAIESAEVTLVEGDLLGIEKAINLGRGVMRNIKQNLLFAFGYNVLGIPIAAGLLYPFFGILLSPMIAAAAMSFSSFSVIVNSLRLRNMNLEG